MAKLGPGQQPVVMPTYPHMMAQDVDVWSRYLESWITPIKRVWYDVHVGKAVVPAGVGDVLAARIAAGVTRKRIDVICQVGGGYWVVEVKPFGSYLALGQVLNYSRLFIDEYRPDGEVWPVIVCNKADPDLLDDFEDSGVACIEVGSAVEI